jgi:hypothetical protein
MLFRNLNNLLSKIASQDRPTRASTRPELEVLEARTVPSFVVADFPGYGVYRYDTLTMTWGHLNGHDAATLAVDSTTGDVVATFQGYGTAEWTPATGWRTLTGAEASQLAFSGSDQNVVGQFGGDGIWAFHPSTGWAQLTAANSSSLSVDAAGDVAAEFPGSGVWYFAAPSSTWTQLTAAEASQVVLGDVGYVVAEFPGSGVWDVNASDNNWHQINGNDALSLAGSGAGGLVGMSFGGYGTYSYDRFSGQYTRLSYDIANDLATNGTDFAAVCQDNGTFHYDASTGQWNAIDDLDAFYDVGIGG